MGCTTNFALRSETWIYQSLFAPYDGSLSAHSATLAFDLSPWIAKPINSGQTNFDLVILSRDIDLIPKNLNSGKREPTLLKKSHGFQLEKE